MDTINSQLPLLAILVPLFTPIFLLALRKSPNARESVTFLAGALTFYLVFLVVSLVKQGIVLEQTLVSLTPGVSLSFRVDGMGALFALLSSFLWIVTSLYAVGYMRGLKEHSQTRFFSFFAFAMASTIGVAFSANLFTLYLFYELLSFSTYPLVAHHQDPEARSAGRKYLTYIVGSSIGLVLPAMLLVYFASGTLDFNTAGIIGDSLTTNVASILFLFFLFGFAKAGIMPMHAWLPGAMVAPTPVSSLLHAVAVVKVGVFSLIRIVTCIYGVDYFDTLSLFGADLQTIACLIAGFTVVASSLIAMTQDGLKRRLAFSTVGQLGYIVLGVLLLTPAAVTGALVHVLMHAFGKITLFFCAGAIYVAHGKKYISQLHGFGRVMPITMFAFLVGSLSVVGLPPAGGFVSKWFLVKGAYANGDTLFVLAYLVSSFLGAFYLLSIPFDAFFKKATDEGEVDEVDMEIQEAPLACLIPIVLTSVMTILLFVYPDFFFELAALSFE